MRTARCTMSAKFARPASGRDARPREREAARRSRFGVRHEDRHVGPLARGAQRGRAGVRVGDDRRGVDRVRDLPRGGADRVGARVLGRAASARISSASRAGRASHAADDAVHDRDRLDRIVAGARSRPRASPRRRRHRPRSRRRRPRPGSASAHGSSIPASASRRSPACRRARQAGMICFCTGGTSSGGISTPRSPRATMMPSRQLDDLVEMLDRRRLLELGHDAGAAGHELARLGDVLRRAARRRAPPSRRRASARRRGRVRSFCGQRRQRQHSVRAR